MPLCVFMLWIGLKPETFLKPSRAALEATLRLYQDPERARREIPTLQYLGRSSAATGAPHRSHHRSSREAVG